MRAKLAHTAVAMRGYRRRVRTSPAAERRLRLPHARLARSARGLRAVYGSIGVVRRWLFAIVGGVGAIAGRVIAVARGQVAVACGLFAVQLSPLTVAPCPARGLLGASGSVADVGDAVASVGREIVLGGRRVALGRHGGALGRRGVAVGRGLVTRLPDTSALVGRLLTFAGRATTRFAAALIASLTSVHLGVSSMLSCEPRSLRW